MSRPTKFIKHITAYDPVAKAYNRGTSASAASCRSSLPASSHRSAHEMPLNSAAVAEMGVTDAMVIWKGQASDQADLAAGHFFEKGLELIVRPVLRRMAGVVRCAAEDHGVLCPAEDFFPDWEQSSTPGVSGNCEPSPDHHHRCATESWPPLGIVLQRPVC
jgi:hypothetical protein